MVLLCLHCMPTGCCLQVMTFSWSLERREVLHVERACSSGEPEGQSKAHCPGDNGSLQEDFLEKVGWANRYPGTVGGRYGKRKEAGREPRGEGGVEHM